MANITLSDRLREAARGLGTKDAPKFDVTPQEEKKEEPIVVGPNLQQIMMGKALEMLEGGGRGGGGGRVPQQPKPALDYVNLMNIIASQPVGTEAMPRTMGMSIDDVHREWSSINKAMDKQMEQYLAAGGAANQQQQQVFENAMKIRAANESSAARGRSEMMQYLSMAHQLAQDDKQAKMLEKQMKGLEIQEKKAKAEIERIAATTELLKGKREQLGKEKPVKPDKLKDDIAKYAVTAFATNLDKEKQKTLTEDPNFVGYINTAMQIAKADATVMTEAQYNQKLKKATEEYIKNPLKAVALTNAQAPEQVIPTAPSDNLNDPANIQKIIDIFTSIGME